MKNRVIVSDPDYTRMCRREAKLGRACAKTDKIIDAMHDRAECLLHIRKAKQPNKASSLAQALNASFWAGYLSVVSGSLQIRQPQTIIL